MATDESCALVVVVDVSVSLWSKSIAPGGGGGGGGEAVAGKNEKNFKVSDFVEHLHAFLNAYLLVHARNRVGVVAISDSKSHLIRLPSLGGRDLCSSDASRSSGSGRNKRESVLDDLKNGLEQVYQKDYVKEVGDQGAENENGREGEGEGEEKHDGVALSAAYSRALCLLKRHQESVSRSVSGGGGYEAHQAGHEEGNNADEARQCQRLLFLSGSKDVPAQYIQVMNASFCAQKMNVIVDTFMLGGVDSSFLQQAATITGGIYTNFFSDDVAGSLSRISLSSYLVNLFLADPNTRKHLKLPQGHKSTNLKVSCFLTKKALDVGFVCSVCLSIFSERLQTCAVCGTSFQESRAMKKKVLNRS